MKYTVKIDGKTYELPARTSEMDEKIDRTSELHRVKAAGEITLREMRQEQYDFLSLCIQEPLPDLTEIDVAEMEVACMEIVNAYTAPVIKAKVEAIMGSVRSVVNRPEIQKLLILSEAQKNEKNEVF